MPPTTAETVKADHAAIFKKIEILDFYSKFHYPALSSDRREIPLLHVNGHGRNHHRHVSNVSVLDNLKYTALSYTCGSPDNTEFILVDGLSFNAFANLAKAIAAVSACWEKQHPGQDLFFMDWPNLY